MRDVGVDPDITILVRDLEENGEVEIRAPDVPMGCVAGIEVGEARGHLGRFVRQLGEGPLPAIGCGDLEIFHDLGVAGVVPVLEPGDDGPVDAGLGRGVNNDKQGIGFYRLLEFHGCVVIDHAGGRGIGGLGLAGLGFYLGSVGHNAVGTELGGEVASTNGFGANLLKVIVGGTGRDHHEGGVGHVSGILGDQLEEGLGAAEEGSDKGGDGHSEGYGYTILLDFKWVRFTLSLSLSHPQ